MIGEDIVEGSDGAVDWANEKDGDVYNQGR